MSDTNNIANYTDTLAAAAVSFIAADDARGRFERFCDAVGDRSRIVGFYRDVEKERLLSGGDGPIVTMLAVESIGGSGSRPADARDNLFFAVTEALSTRGISLNDSPRNAAAA